MAATRTASRPRGSVSRRPAPLTLHTHGAVDKLQRVAIARKPLARLAMIGVPLAMAAAMLTAQWWMLAPLIACAWWWAPRTWGWEWLVAVQTGFVGAAWAELGAVALGTWPERRLLIGAVWIASAASLAVLSAIGRQRERR